MGEHPIEQLMRSTMENLKAMVDVNTIVGDPVKSSDGSIIIPISKVGFGFASGGSEFASKEKAENMQYPFGGGSGAGVSIKPVAFLVMKGEFIRLLTVDSQNTYDKIINSVPQIIDILKNVTKDKKNKNKEEEEKEDEE